MNKSLEIIEFWIGEARADPIVAQKKSKLWYQGGKQTDDRIRLLFGESLTQAESGHLDDWMETAQGSLALVILLDQFSRNLYRKTAKAFSNDEKALQISRAALRNQQDSELTIIERVFLCHPFHHAENIPDQKQAVKLFTDIKNHAPEPWHKQLQSFIDYAQHHHNIIHQFGRFPHRNSILVRKNTPEENLYLNANKNSFGQ